MPAAAGAVGVPVGEKGAVPRQLGLDRATLDGVGFDGKVGQTLVVPRRDGPTVVAVGVGDPRELDAARLRDVAAAFARAAAKHGHLATTLADVAGVGRRGGRPGDRRRHAARPLPLRRAEDARRRGTGLTDVTLVAGAGRAAAVERGAERGPRRSPTPPSWPATWPTRRPGT